MANTAKPKRIAKFGVVTGWFPLAQAGHVNEEVLASNTSAVFNPTPFPSHASVLTALTLDDHRIS